MNLRSGCSLFSENEHFLTLYKKKKNYYISNPILYHFHEICFIFLIIIKCILTRLHKLSVSKEVMIQTQYECIHLFLHFLSELKTQNIILTLTYVREAVQRSRNGVRIFEPLRTFLLNTICSSNEFGLLQSL